MQSKPKDFQCVLFTSRLEQIINLEHPLCKLANVIDWPECTLSPLDPLVKIISKKFFIFYFLTFLVR